MRLSRTVTGKRAGPVCECACAAGATGVAAQLLKIRPVSEPAASNKSQPVVMALPCGLVGVILVRAQACDPTAETHISSAPRPLPSPVPHAMAGIGRTSWLSTSRRCCRRICRRPRRAGPGLPNTISPAATTTRDQVPVDDLIAAATASLQREGRNLATYSLAHGPQGYRPLREFLVDEAQARRRHRLHGRRYPAGVRLAAGARSRQRRAARARRYRDLREGQLPGHAHALHAARRQPRSASRSTATACGWMRSTAALADCKARGVQPKFIYTIPTVQNPTATIMPRSAARGAAAARRSNTACRSSRTTATRT